jgi:hypothetical protein
MVPIGKKQMSVDVEHRDWRRLVEVLKVIGHAFRVEMAATLSYRLLDQVGDGDIDNGHACMVARLPPTATALATWTLADLPGRPRGSRPRQGGT